jgi:teichuronic acid biosynthesis glycosyltransferase TuaH
MTRGYVIYGPTPWDGPANAAHNIARALAARHPVLYVEPPLSPLTPIRFGLRRSSWSRAGALLDRRVRRAGDLQTFGPLALPPLENARARSLSAPLVRAQVARAVGQAELGPEPVVLGWRGLPELAGAAGECATAVVIMDHPGGAAVLSGLPVDYVEDEVAARCAACELIFTTSHPTQELLAEQGWRSELVPFGFPADLVDAYDAAVEPPEYRALPRPLLGYTGGIDDRLDFELIVALADRFSEGSLVLVGHPSPRLSRGAREALASRPNIHLPGPRERESLPAYIRYLDVALLPYRDTLFTRHQSPMKVWEYFYAGPPVVGVASPELRYYPHPLVSYAEYAAAVPGLVEEALARPALGAAERRRFALANTWDDRAAQIDRAVGEHLEARVGERPAGTVPGGAYAEPEAALR